MKIIKKIKNIIPSIISEVGFKCKEFCHWYGNGTIFQCVIFKFDVHYILLKLFENLRFSTTSIYDNKTEQKIADVIKNMTTKDARHIALSKRQLFRLKKRIKAGKRIVLKKKTVKKLMTTT